MNMPQAHVDIAGYLLGLLGPGEAWQVEQHLAGCDVCRREVVALREVEASLEDVPPELFFDGPDPDAEFLMERTLRKARTESRSRRTGRTFTVAAASVAILAIAVGGGVVLGRSGQPTNVAGPEPSTSTSSAVVAGTKTADATDPTTGARLTATVTPAAGWVRVHAKVQGVKEGEKCRLMVVGRPGDEEIAGSWVIGAKAAEYGLSVDGDALISPDDVTAVKVVTLDGRTLVSVPV